jgi:hypothetical protein
MTHRHLEIIMGHRTVVVLSNDQPWDRDPDLGRKISEAASYLSAGRRDGFFLGGNVIEQVHADTNTLMVIDSLSGTAMARNQWHAGQTEQQRNFDLLKEMAERMGYGLRKLPTKKA